MQFLLNSVLWSQQSQFYVNKKRNSSCANHFTLCEFLEEILKTYLNCTTGTVSAFNFTKKKKKCHSCFFENKKDPNKTISPFHNLVFGKQWVTNWRRSLPGSKQALPHILFFTSIPDLGHWVWGLVLSLAVLKYIYTLFYGWRRFGSWWDDSIGVIVQNSKC